MTQFNANIIVLAGDESVIVGVLDAMAANYAKGLSRIHEMGFDDIEAPELKEGDTLEEKLAKVSKIYGYDPCIAFDAEPYQGCSTEEPDPIVLIDCGPSKVLLSDFSTDDDEIMIPSLEQFVPFVGEFADGQLGIAAFSRWESSGEVSFNAGNDLDGGACIIGKAPKGTKRLAKTFWGIYEPVEDEEWETFLQEHQEEPSDLTDAQMVADYQLAKLFNR